ncbi:MAG: biotin/lipoate A/B protein ligase family protein [Cyanophyceae cyanobacterium]
MTDTWRLIPPVQASGSVQMALDRWLLEQHQHGHPPTLRFYTWSPVAISLGYHQRQYPHDWNHLYWQGQPIELVRRPTGGRAVLHQGDLTYAVVMSASGRLLEVYTQICQFLIVGWRSLGVELQYGARQRYAQTHNCFRIATGADLVTADGRKLIGSAQLRQGQAVLQHGSMMLSPHPELFTCIFDRAPQGIDILQSTVAQALIHAAEHCFKMQLIEQPLSETEWQEVISLSS